MKERENYAILKKRGLLVDKGVSSVTASEEAHCRWARKLTAFGRGSSLPLGEEAHCLWARQHRSRRLSNIRTPVVHGPWKGRGTSYVLPSLDFFKKS
jgi:hypothetical protein